MVGLPINHEDFEIIFDRSESNVLKLANKFEHWRALELLLNDSADYNG